MKGRGVAEHHELEILVRPEERGDRKAVSEVVCRAFGRKAEVGLIDAIRSSPGWIGELSLVAVVDGRIVGHVLLSRIAVASKAGDYPALALAPVAVDPDWQSRGAGTALVRAGLERARRLGETLVVVLGHPNYYPRFGFQPAKPLGILPPFTVRDEVFMALSLRPGGELPVPGTVVYPSAFAGV